jgi:RimJ/RimL family protein N-acetyltransferase
MAHKDAITLETERLTIRTFTKADLSEFKKLLDNPGVPGWQAQIPTAEQFLDWYISMYDKMDIQTGVVCFGIFDNKIAVGAVGAGRHVDLQEPEIFYNILPDYRGRGYATEAADAITKWVMKNYDISYLIGDANVVNIASQRVLEKCGYKLSAEKTPLVQALKEKYDFKYYRYYR